MNQSSKQLLAQAAQKLMTAVHETGLAQPTPFADALLELIESSSKLQEFDDMAMEAKTRQSESEEAQTWQQISLMTLQFCREGMVDRQQKALQKVMELASQGATLHSQGTIASCQEISKTNDAAAKPPPGVFFGPPPGLTAPPGLAAPPGLELSSNGGNEKAVNKAGGEKAASKAGNQKAGGEKLASKATGDKDKLPPWRRNPQKASKSHKEPTLLSLPTGPPKDVGFFADESFWGSQLNVDAYDSD